MSVQDLPMVYRREDGSFTFSSFDAEEGGSVSKEDGEEELLRRGWAPESIEDLNKSRRIGFIDTPTLECL